MPAAAMHDPLYTVADWDRHYETAETRRLTRLRWVPVPNRHDSLTFRRIAGSPHACDLYAAWCLILQIASRGPPNQRGRLEREGVPLTAGDMALMTGFPPDIFERALRFFTTHGWLVSSAPVAPDTGHLPGLAGSSPGDHPEITRRSPGDHPEITPAEWKERTEGKKETVPSPLRGGEGGSIMDAAESTIPFQLEVSAGPSAAPIDRTPYDAILQLWAEFCPHLPQPQIPTAARKKAMQTFWAGVVRESTARGIQPLDWIGALFRFVAASDFLSGRSTAWRANLWWVIRPGNCAKVVDGNYDNHTPAAAR